MYTSGLHIYAEREKEMRVTEKSLFEDCRAYNYCCEESVAEDVHYVNCRLTRAFGYKEYIL